MTDFKLTDEQRQYQQLARDFVEKEIAPRAAYHDETGEFAGDILRKAWELGLVGAHIPERYGGLGLSTLDGCLIAEEFGAGCTGIGAALDGNNLAQAPLLVAGTDEQKKEFLEPMTGDFSLAAYCASEPGSELDALKATTTAKRAGDEYVINGAKSWCINAGVARWHCLVAATDPAGGAAGLSVFVIPGDTAGIAVGEGGKRMGQRAADLRAVTFRDVKVPRRCLVGREGDGARILGLAAARAYPLLSCSAVGLGRSAMEHSMRYSKQRVTFGLPIASHQAVAFMVADMDKDICAARLLAWQAAWLSDSGTVSGTQAVIARTFALDMAVRVAVDAVQVFGGYGYSREYPVEKLMRDAKMLQVVHGSGNLHKVALGRQLVGVGR